MNEYLYEINDPMSEESFLRSQYVTLENQEELMYIKGNEKLHKHRKLSIATEREEFEHGE